MKLMNEVVATEGLIGPILTTVEANDYLLGKMSSEVETATEEFSLPDFGWLLLVLLLGGLGWIGVISIILRTVHFF